MLEDDGAVQMIVIGKDGEIFCSSKGTHIYTHSSEHTYKYTQSRAHNYYRPSKLELLD